MFLMNNSALVALQRKWEPFAQSRNYRYPVCFSESEDDIARSAVSANVQMIINNLQTEESSLHSSREYGCIMQKKQKGAKGRGHKLRRRGRILKDRVTYPKHGCPADSDGMEVEESSEFGPILLPSDSDDSVDRDIEEAIQEYLKNKGPNLQPLSSRARSLHGLKRAKKVSLGDPCPNPACNVFPANVKPNVVQQHLAPECLGNDANQWVASPCSVSSDDSFEQSIKVEIEQFLNEKKEEARKGTIATGNKQLHHKETHDKLALRSQKEDTGRMSQSSLKQGQKALFVRQHLELQDSSTLQCWKSNSDEEPADFKPRQTQMRTLLTDRSLLLEKNREDEKRQKLWKARGEQMLERKDLSDSSSDDGIEEAIQLYQLEKSRKAADSQTSCGESRAGRAKNISPYLIHSVKSALPEMSKKALNKRKQVTSESEELNRITDTPHHLDSLAPAKNNVATCAVMLQASCQADTAAELMCAEAILDISKTILPPPLGSNLFFSCQDTSVSQHGSDSNAVDSDDSIEQEIRAFLAVKAQTEHLVTKSRASSHLIQIPHSSGRSVESTQNLKHTSPKPLKLSLSRKRKPKGESKFVREIQDPRLRLSEIGCGCVDNSHPRISAFHIEDGVAMPQNSETQTMAGYQQDILTYGSSVDFANLPLQRFIGLGGNATQIPQKCGVDDKSSSLDSDEDLDMAIKELLRSKRILKKKPKDQRVQCKKRVRFDDSEIHVFRNKERDCRSKKATMLKSCLMNSQRDIRMENAEPQNAGKGKPKSTMTMPFEFGRDDSSSIDSDDSIEQEIQRFLAEKSKDSAISTNIPGPNGIVEHLGVDKSQAALSKAKYQQFQDQGRVHSKQKKTIKKAGPPMIGLRNSLRPEDETARNASHRGEQIASYTDSLYSLTAMSSGVNKGIVPSGHIGLPIKRTTEGRKIICGGKLNQRSLPLGRDKAKNHALQSCFKPLSPFKCKKSFEFKISNNFIASLKSARNDKKPVLLGRRQSSEFSLFKSQGNVSIAHLPGEWCEMTPKRETLSSRGETQVREADIPARYTAKGLHLCISENSGETLIATPFCNIAKVKLSGDQEACCSLDSNPGSGLQEPRRQNVIAEVRVGAESNSVEIPQGEEDSISQEEGESPAARVTYH